MQKPKSGPKATNGAALIVLAPNDGLIHGLKSARPKADDSIALIDDPKPNGSLSNRSMTAPPSLRATREESVEISPCRQGEGQAQSGRERKPSTFSPRC